MTAEAVAFWALGLVAVVGAVGVVAAPRAVYSAIFLAGTMISLAMLYVTQDALFLGVVQVVVYTGAVMMLFLFVLMLVGVDSTEALTESLRGQRVASVVAGIGFGILLIAALGAGVTAGFSPIHAPDGNVEGLAVLIFTRHLWAFELTSALLITAALGAMVLAHRERFARRPSQRELARRRFHDLDASSSYAGTLPASGVYARANAVDVPARLPDGSPARNSVSAILVQRDPDEAGAHPSDDGRRP